MTPRIMYNPGRAAPDSLVPQSCVDVFFIYQVLAIPPLRLRCPKVMAHAYIWRADLRHSVEVAQVM